MIISANTERIMKAADGKAQHYVPESYLKGFTDKNQVLWVCDKSKAIRPSRPKDEANKPDYYTHTKDGTRDETAEEALSVIESQAAIILKKIGNSQYKLTPETAGTLYFFVAFMFARVPTMREYIDKVVCATERHKQKTLAKDKQKFEESWRQYEQDTGRSAGDLETLRQFILNGKYKINQESAAFNLGAMFDFGFVVLDKLMRCNYEVLYAPPGHHFVTSDSPVFTCLRDKHGVTFGMGFEWPGVHTLFPLNKRACLRLRKGASATSRHISAYLVAEINKFTMACAAQHLYMSTPDDRLRTLFEKIGCNVKPGVNAFMTPEMEEHLVSEIDASSSL
jgi:Protein of unknown function (DUF4238)